MWRWNECNWIWSSRIEQFQLFAERVRFLGSHDVDLFLFRSGRCRDRLRTFFFVLVYYVIVADSDTNDSTSIVDDSSWSTLRPNPLWRMGPQKVTEIMDKICLGPRLFFFSHFFFKIQNGLFSKEQGYSSFFFEYKWYMYFFLQNETFKRPWEVLASHTYFSSNHVSVELESLQDDCCLYKSDVIFQSSMSFLLGGILSLEAEVCDLHHSLFLGLLCGIRMGLCHLLCQGLTTKKDSKWQWQSIQSDTGWSGVVSLGFEALISIEPNIKQIKDVFFPSTAASVCPFPWEPSSARSWHLWWEANRGKGQQVVEQVICYFGK